MNDTFERAKGLFLEGIGHFEAGRMLDAEQCFEQSLALLPGRASTLANLGAVRVALGKSAQALAVLDEALALDDSQADAWFQRGIALAQLARNEDAVASLERATAIDAQCMPAWLHLGGLRNELHRHAQALAAFERALVLDAEHGEAWFRHGQTLQALDRHDEALESYERALALDPAQPQAWINRGGILRERGHAAGAAAAYRQALVHGGDAELIAFFLASVEGQGDAPAAAPRAHVQQLFDAYAERFDAHLVQVLRYRGHELLCEALKRAADGRRFERALDLGCGTGLCGALIKPIAAHIDGVDLSAQMLEQARQLQVYDELRQADVTEHLAGTAQRYDLIVAGDVFTYIGDLDATFAAARRVLLAHGLFGFSVEAARDAVDFELRGSLRFAHSRRHIEALARRHAFAVRGIQTQPLREDQQQPIDALYVVLSR
jgi:predicted TPR repeat methyltransferase